MPRKKTDIVQLKIRLREATRAQIERAAKAHDQTLNAEAVDRIEDSLRVDDTLGGTHTRTVLRALAAAAALIELRSGKKWREEWGTFHATRTAWRRIVDAQAPRAAGKITELLEASEAAMRSSEPTPPPTYPSYEQFCRERGFGFGLLGRGLTDEQHQEYDQIMKQYKSEYDAWKAKSDAHLEEQRQTIEATKAYISTLEALGLEVADAVLQRPEANR